MNKLRPYLTLTPSVGKNVMIDDSSVIIGDVRLADDVGIWPLVVAREMSITFRLVSVPIFRTAPYYMSLTRRQITRPVTR